MIMRAVNRVGFAIGTCDPPVVIDSALAYSTYLGGTSDHVDAYVTGGTRCTRPKKCERRMQQGVRHAISFRRKQ